MKTVKLRKSFKRDYNKLDKKRQSAYSKAFWLFAENQIDRRLRRHKLSDKYKGLESIDITPDLRLLFLEDDNSFVFYCIKNHSQLYD